MENTDDPFHGLPQMKEMDLSNPSSAKMYLTRPPEQTHTKEELDALHRAIRFTRLFKHEESMAKMNEEELIQRPLPKLY